jgi:5-methylcytosine-specific restriction endonuclease McrA
MRRADYHPEWEAISRAIRRRAKGQCELCFLEEGTRRVPTGGYIVLTVHHIDGDRKNNDPQNLIALCQRCHLRLDRAYKSKRRRSGQKELI